MQTGIIGLPQVRKDLLRRFVVCGFFCLAVCISARCEEVCSEARLDVVSTRAKMVRDQLLAVKVEQMNTSVSPPIRELIRELKEALRAAIHARLKCQKDEAPNVDSLRRSLLATLGADQPEQPVRHDPNNLDEIEDHVYGSELKIDVKKVDSKLSLIGVEVSFGVSCGVDTMLLMYEWRDRDWQEVLSWQSDDYDAVSGAFGDFF